MTCCICILLLGTSRVCLCTKDHWLTHWCFCTEYHEYHTEVNGDTALSPYDPVWAAPPSTAPKTSAGLPFVQSCRHLAIFPFTMLEWCTQCFSLIYAVCFSGTLQWDIFKRDLQCLSWSSWHVTCLQAFLCQQDKDNHMYMGPTTRQP